MLTKEAIQELAQSSAIDAANRALHNLHDPAGTGSAALPETFKLHDLEAFLPHRRRPRGRMTTPVLDDFAAYAEEHSEQGATVFVDAAKMEATAVLNLGSPDAPGHADSLAVFAPLRTAAYGALLGSTGRALSQKDAAEFLEDWMPHVLCFSGDEKLIETKHAIAAVRAITIESQRKVESTEQSLAASRSAFEAVAASSAGRSLPAIIHFLCAPYSGMSERPFHARLAILTGDKAPAITLRIIAMERRTEEMAAELADMVRTAIDGAVPVHVGAYQRGA